MLNIILQSDPVTSIWTMLADKGLTLAILGVGIYVVWKNYQANNAKIEKYMLEDRDRLLSALNNSNELIKNNTEVVQDLKEFIREISEKHSIKI